MRILKYKYNSKTIPLIWKAYFTESIEGKEYTLLLNDEDHLVMSNTELEIRTNKEILLEAYGDVLLIGLGINLINDKVLELDKVNSVDTIENNQWVIDNIPTKTNVLFGDYQNYNYTKKYDIIWFDAYDHFDAKPLLKLLKPKGKLLCWKI